MIEDEVNELIRAKLQALQWKTEASKLEDELLEKFKEKKNWGLFLKRHGMNSDWEEYLDGHQYYSIHFSKDDKCEIWAEDHFRGECTNSESTREFPIQEFIDFMNSEDYYAPLLGRLERLKLFRQKRSEEEAKERRRKLYEELKKEFKDD